MITTMPGNGLATTNTDQIKNIISAFCCDLDDVWVSQDGHAFSVDRCECKPLETVYGLNTQFPERAPWGIVLGRCGVTFLDKDAPGCTQNTHTLQQLSKCQQPTSGTSVVSRYSAKLEADPFRTEYKYVPVGDDEYAIKRWDLDPSYGDERCWIRQLVSTVGDALGVVASGIWIWAWWTDSPTSQTEP